MSDKGGIVGAFLAAVWLHACSGVVVQSELPEREANEIVAVLLRAGIAADKVRAATGEGRFGVEVAASDAARAFDLLREAGLPRPPSTGFADLYAGDRLVPTASEERARLQAALTGELARSIETIDGVLEARVHVSVPERDPMEAGDGGEEPTRASVLIRYASPTPPFDEASVKRLVAGGVPGLRDTNVAVIGVRRTTSAIAPRPALAEVAGVHVAPASAGTLRAMIGGLLALVVVLSATLVAVLIRARRALAREKKPQ